jgi:hypothetical protein
LASSFADRLGDNAQSWSGTISVGTPPVNFTGMTFLHDDSKPLTDPRHGTVNFDTGSSDPLLTLCRNVDQGTDCMTPMQVWLRTIPLRYSHCLSEMDPLSMASN